jgi:hypothetical protein
MILCLGVSIAHAEPDDGLSARIFNIRFKSVEDVVLLIEPYIGERGSYMVQPRLKAITVRDEVDRLARIADLIASFDQPPRSVRLVIQLLDAVEAPATGSRRGTKGTRLDSVLGVTKWTDYSVLGEASIVGVEGAQSALNLSDRYRVRFNVDAVAERQQVVKFDRFALDRITRADDGEIRYTPILDTALNLHDGQRLLLGITNSRESARALFLSVSATLEPSGPVSATDGE